MPLVYTPLLEFDKILADSELDHIQREKIKIRMSQIYGCAYCINAHAKDPLNMANSNKAVCQNLKLNFITYKATSDNRPLLGSKGRIGCQLQHAEAHHHL
jgi:AhpD family alkylhydroperoxidase